MRTTAALIILCMTGGCQSAGYQQYADAMARIAESNASVAREQTAAMMRLAEFGGDQTTRTVAVIMLAMGGAQNKQQVQVAPPQNEALQWASVLASPLTAITLGLWAYKANKHAVDASSDTTIAGYNAMQGIAQSGFNAVGSFKPVPIDWSKLPPVNQTSIDITNGAGQVVIGGDGTYAPVAIVPPVVVVPVAGVPTVVRP